MTSSRILRSTLILVSMVGLTALAAGGGCATADVPGGKGGSATSGSGSGEARCAGTPPACTGLDDFDCPTTNGCAHVGACQGTALDCASLPATGCAKQPGCTSTLVTSGSGSAQQCFNFSNQSVCAQQKGCVWDSEIARGGARSFSTRSRRRSSATQGKTLCGYRAPGRTR